MGQEVGRPIDPEQSEWPRRDRNAGPKGSGGSSMLWVGAVEVSQELAGGHCRCAEFPYLTDY